ncbi:MAG TPA: polysaccharide biosynthesis C-terminal domain-containing protein, partial [Gemmatimonadales bacterium]|nr:polysaccharide biosynthesis C-terminal domain-containing protein [Gemmatimonadales bacterium]
LFGTVQLLVWSDEIATVWLGPAYGEAVPLIRILMAGVVPYLGHAMLRTTIDGLEEKAVNTHNMYAACATTLVLSLALGAGFGAPGLAVAGAAGFIVLGLLTIRHLWMMLRPVGQHLAVRHALWLNLLLAAAALGLHRLLVPRFPSREALGIGLGAAGVGFAAYLVVLRRLRVRWVSEIEQRLRPRESTR